MFGNLFKNSNGAKRISGTEAKEAVEKNNAVIVDVREVSEFNSGHIKNALNIPVAGIEFNATNLLKNKDQFIIVHCLSGGRSARAGKTLVSLGYTNVHDLGGIGNWPEALVK